jgi:hypothetical protein
MTALAERTEVLNPGQRSLRELADEANREGRLLHEAGVAVVEHAIRMGEYLQQAKDQVEAGHWQQWLAENFEYGNSWARVAMRAARNQKEVRASGVTSLRGMRNFLTAIDASHAPTGVLKRPQWMKDEALRLRAEGSTLPAIAQELEISVASAYLWTNPDAVKRKREYDSRRHRQRLAATRALTQQQQDKAIKQAVKKQGGAIAELYAIAERAQDVQGQAHREATDRERREALARAGEPYRKWRDEIVRALGVA